MRLNDDVAALEIGATLMGGQTLIHPAVILDEVAGHTLVDAGMPGMEGAIEAALAELGIGLGDIRQVIVTHHDLDHIGGLPAVVAASGAQVWALEREVPFIEGQERPQKMPPPERVAEMLADPATSPAMRAMLSAPPTTAKVDRALQDGEVLPLAGGVRVVATPGHTKGHLSLFAERSRTLITGDALTSKDGQLHGPMERATPDMPTAWQSANKLAQLGAQTVLTYHGGVVSENADEQLRQVAAQGDAPA
ncbi:MBL fold metallo-hydrolase [Deinococcus irradiatisoli]|uniref:MBL fold metallo-hydrolase n=1 Tax=Deinococcus irradiatisoli TaxID=2202254 RepID=A0A2Z3JCH6_9DEIO|nr:MBL fold metallo-hydrolase [Deinococcus irradiatisoli]AWN22867.1 MBL fold metallo-hydrolase [Deinococcus irradiatisoli]